MVQHVDDEAAEAARMLSHSSPEELSVGQHLMLLEALCNEALATAELRSCLLLRLEEADEVLRELRAQRQEDRKQIREVMAQLKEERKRKKEEEAARREDESGRRTEMVRTIHTGLLNRHHRNPTCKGPGKHIHCSRQRCSSDALVLPKMHLPSTSFPP